MMYYFTPDTIVQANNNIKALDPKVGGLMCILSCLAENIEENVSYTINGESLRKQLSFVFDKEPKDSFESAKPSYIIFAKDWATTFFNKIIKNKVDLLSCAVFFLRRQSFEREYNREEVIDLFIKRFNLENYKESWFYDSTKLQLNYNQSKVEDNQAEFYIKMEYTTSFESVLFDSVIKKSAAELKSAGQIQTLYSGSGIQTCLLLSDEPLDQRYVMSNSGQIVDADIIMSLRGISNEELSEDDLVDILKNMYNNPESTGKAMTPQILGLKYGAVIDRGNYSVETIASKAGLSVAYGAEIRKGYNIYKAIKNNEYGLAFSNKITELINEDVNSTRVLGGYNKIYYGAPGCGKSFLVNDLLDKANVPELNRIRVTFHPEYANCDFVGQILPTIEKRIDENTGEEKEVVKYIFNPGPFTLAIERARQTNDMVYLIIEEINRGNAAAIFGDLFQLLDREKDPTKPNFGESEYPICNVNMQKYLELGEGDKLVIPSNLTIFATMNTSDQNVFTLDTAFKRRWSFEQISNNIKDDTKHEYKRYYIPGTDVTLERFLTVINREILNHKITSEDKRMGKYFVSKDCLTETVCAIADAQTEAEMFAYKVLEYIWNDVCKIGKDDWFDTSAYQTLEDVIEAFVHPKDGESPLSVFKSITF